MFFRNSPKRCHKVGFASNEHGIFIRSLFYSEETACGSDTLAVLLNSQRCVMKGMKIWHTVKAWVLLTGRHLYECVCVCVCVTLLQPPLYIKGKIKPTNVSRTVRAISVRCNCGNKKPWFTFEKTNAILIVSNKLLPETRPSAPKYSFRANRVWSIVPWWDQHWRSMSRRSA